jgi:glycosyltransferase involved in cell wall biosynthesis
LGVNVLLLNWRDIRSPRAGGAEALTFEVARRLVHKGHRVTWFTSEAPSLPPREVVDGIEIVRRGSEFTTRFHAPGFARTGSWDVIVEEINTLPYFSHLWADEPTVLFIPQIAREVWWYEAPAPLALIGRVLEPGYLSSYRRVETITISRSTRDDLRELGFRAPIHIIPMATGSPALPELGPKDATGELAIVGRLVRSKRVDHAIRALAEVRRRVPHATLTVVGVGPELDRLRETAAVEGVAGAVDFTGRVSETEKLAILQRASLLVACAVREGWGLTVTEAARVGTPSACYAIPGLRDSVIDGRTGVLTPESPTALAEAIVGVLGDPVLYDRLREAAWRTAASLGWDATADAFERVVVAAAEQGASSRAG